MRGGKACSGGRKGDIAPLYFWEIRKIEKKIEEEENYEWKIGKCPILCNFMPASPTFCKHSCMREVCVDVITGITGKHCTLCKEITFVFG